MVVISGVLATNELLPPDASSCTSFEREREIDHRIQRHYSIIGQLSGVKFRKSPPAEVVIPPVLVPQFLRGQRGVEAQSGAAEQFRFRFTAVVYLVVTTFAYTFYKKSLV
ncbi:hypothetical protein ACJJTC_011231 [Scirpophaga incertulas]